MVTTVELREDKACGKLRKFSALLIYTAFIVLQFINHISLILWGDDYYYAAFIKNGFGYFVSENIFHYRQTNGRAFVHILDELLLSGNMWIWRVFNIAVISVIVLYIAKIASRSYLKGPGRGNFPLALTGSVILFSSINVFVLRQSVYWATGAMNYLFPVAPVLIYYYYCRLDFERQGKYRYYITLLGLIASVTVEQSAVAAFLISAYMIFSCFVQRRRVRIQYWVNLAVTVAGMASVIFAPGNSVRKAYYPDFYAMTISKRIKTNIYGLTAEIFGSDVLFIYILALLAILVALSVKKLIESKSVSKKVFWSFAGIYSAAAAVLYYLTVYGHRIICWNRYRLIIISCSVIIPMLILIIHLVTEYFSGRDSDSAPMLLLAAAMQAAMLISPLYGPRTELISIILIFVVILRGVLDLSNSALFGAGIITLASGIAFGGYTAVAACAVSVPVFVLIGKSKLKPAVPALIICTVFSLYSLYSVGAGYRQNDEINRYNAEQIEKFFKEGADADEIVLKYAANIDYRYTLPYEDSYHMKVFKKLYGIPDDVAVIYK